MRKRKLSPIEMAFKEKEQQELEACERAILEKLSESPAPIKEIDALGFPREVSNRMLKRLLHQEKVYYDFSSHRYYVDSENYQPQQPTGE